LVQVRVSAAVPIFTSVTAPSMVLPARPNVRAELLLMISVAGVALRMRCVPEESFGPE